MRRLAKWLLATPQPFKSNLTQLAYATFASCLSIILWELLRGWLKGGHP
ncbi:MAG: hypothetical protein ABFE07_28745 [Armatimonadia bacterium]